MKNLLQACRSGLSSLLRSGQRPVSGEKKQILFCAHNELTAGYLSRALPLFDASRHEVFLSFFPLSHTLSAPGNIAERCGLPYLPADRISRRAWDLILVADHVYEQGAMPAGVPVVYMPHGLLVMRLKENGRVHRFDRWAFDAQGHSAYRAILFDNESNASAAARDFPALKEAVKVTGCLGVDRMLALRPERERFRRELGIPEGEKAVLIMSSFYPEGLMKKYGRALLDQAARLQGSGRHFIVSAHPNLWVEPGFLELMEEQKARGLRVLDPDEPLEPFLVAADAAVSDFTSLSLAFALLGKPLIYVPIDAGRFDRHSLLVRLAAGLPRLDVPEDMETVLDRAFRDYPHAFLNETARQIYPHPGEAASRMKKEFEKILRIPS